MGYLIAVLAPIVLVGVLLWFRWRGARRRDAALRTLLDGADALEAQLQEYKERMTTLKQLLARLPSDMTAPAMTSINPDSQVKTALRGVLAHRLWIKQEGATATIAALDQACVAIRRSQEQLAEQLKQLDDVGRQLEVAGQGLRRAYLESANAQPERGIEIGGIVMPPPGANGHPHTRH